MMAQNQTFDVISDSAALGEVNLEQYINKPYVLYEYAEASRKLQRGSMNIIEVSFYLEEQERILKRKEYKKVVVSLDLEGEDKKYVKVGKTFLGFDPQDLALVEPDTIFLLAKNNKKYHPVIEQLKNETNITQKRVRELIKLSRKPKKQETSDDNNSDTTKEKVSVWRRNISGKRYCQIGSIHEEDEFTGTTIQRIVKEKSVLPQTVVRQAMSLVEAYESGELVRVENSQELSDGLRKSLFDFERINTSGSVEAPDSTNTDTQSQSSNSEQLQGEKLDSEVNNSDISKSVANDNTNNSDVSELITVRSCEAAKEINNDVNSLDISEPLVMFNTGAAKEAHNDVDSSDINESVAVLDNGAAKEVISDADSVLEEAVIIAEYLSGLETWSEEVVTIMQNCPHNLKLLSWELLDSEQKARIHELKHEFESSDTKVEVEEEISDSTLSPDSPGNLKVGDTVIWDNCHPHLQSWQPFVISKIEGDEAKLEYYANYVPLEELSLAE
ncbi:hypothetical protein RIVM261_089490 [Rivularia sp. IAM M-261]|nr:hypothetical protein RIVM261_089490 [Rivularia sp. IAM M-261]